MKADPDFVEFVMAWHGVTGATDVPFTAENESPAYQKEDQTLDAEGLGDRVAVLLEGDLERMLEGATSDSVAAESLQDGTAWPQSQPSPAE